MPWRILRKRFLDYTPEERQRLMAERGGPIERKFEWIPDTNYPVFERNIDAKRAYVITNDIGFVNAPDATIVREFRAYYANWKNVKLERVKPCKTN